MSATSRRSTPPANAANRELAADTLAFDRLAHDLRSPLGSVRTALQMLKLPNLDATRTRELVDLADRQLMRAVALADAVGDYARLREGRLDLRREPLSVARVVGDVADRIRGAAPGCAVTIDLAPDAGSVAADPLRLSQAIFLLLEPATRGGHPITLGARRQGDAVVFTATATLDARASAIPDLLGEALVAAHDGRLVRSEDGFLVTLAASAS